MSIVVFLCGAGVTITGSILMGNSLDPIPFIKFDGSDEFKRGTWLVLVGLITITFSIVGLLASYLQKKKIFAFIMGTCLILAAFYLIEGYTIK